MNLKRPIELAIYWNGLEATKLKDLGLDLNIEPETRMITFYSIDYIHAGHIAYEDRESGIIRSGGEEFAAVLTYEQLVKLIPEYLC